MSKNNKRQIALSVHFLILYVFYHFDNNKFLNFKNDKFVFLLFYTLSVFLLIYFIRFLDKVLRFFFHNDGYTVEKSVVNEHDDIVKNMFLPNILLNTIDFLTFGAARSFWNAFYFL